MNEKVEDLAFGRWPDILAARGMDRNFFTGRHGPCPFCPDGGGKDRYQWVQRKYGGVWVCRTCTEGKYSSGVNMLMRHMGYTDFVEAVRDVRDYFGTNGSVQPVSREQRIAMSGEMTPEVIERNRARMLKLWNEARTVQEGDPVWQYMQKRVPGMSLALFSIRYHPALEYWAPPAEGYDKPVLLGKFPAMLAYAKAPDGSLAQLHKTYLTLTGDKADVPLVKKTDRGVGVNSFAVRMMEPLGDKLGVCEGLETGWASAMERGIPVWPCLNGPALAAFQLPDELKQQVKTLVIFADSDEMHRSGRNADGSDKFRRPGSHYASELAQNARRQGLRTLIIRPAKVGHDMADYWKEKVAA